jgi:hypothetical protein
MQTFPEKIAETGSAGHPFVAWHGSLDALPSCELSVLFFSLFSYFLFVFSELALLNLSGAVFECIDKSPCTWYVIWGRFGLSGLKQMLVVHHLSLRSWACEGIWVKQFLFALIVVHHLSVRIWACAGVQVKQLLFAVELVSCCPWVLGFFAIWKKKLWQELWMVASEKS